MSRVLDNRIAIHALVASAISPKQQGGLFVLAVPAASKGFFWDVLEREGERAFKAAARSKSRSHRKVKLRNDAEIVLLGCDTNELEGLEDLQGVVVYGAPRGAVDRLRDALQEEPAGWILVG